VILFRFRDCSTAQNLYILSELYVRVFYITFTTHSHFVSTQGYFIYICNYHEVFKIEHPKVSSLPIWRLVIKCQIYMRNHVVNTGCFYYRPTENYNFIAKKPAFPVTYCDSCNDKIRETRRALYIIWHKLWDCL
jgi:hypothetical protein